MKKDLGVPAAPTGLSQVEPVPVSPADAASIPSAGARWDTHFLELALVNARMSKDPSTRVGAVIVGPDREIRSTGFNGFPRGIADTHDRLNHRDTKLKLIVHAEMNAILNAARIGTALKGCTLYLAATDDSGLVWGGPPCTRCTVEAIQAGISSIVSHPFKSVPSRWADDVNLAGSLLEEAGIEYREMPASAMSARSDETPQEAQSEGRQRDPQGDAR